MCLALIQGDVEENAMGAASLLNPLCCFHREGANVLVNR